MAPSPITSWQIDGETVETVTDFILGGSKITVVEKAMGPHSVLLPRKSHGWRSLVGCGPWDCYEPDRTERLHFHLSLSCIGGGNGQPTSVFLPGESQGRGSVVGCRLRSRTESDTTEVTWQQQ